MKSVALRLTPVFLPGESHGQRSLAGYRPRGHKESDMTERLTTATHPVQIHILLIFTISCLFFNVRPDTLNRFTAQRWKNPTLD